MEYKKYTQIGRIQWDDYIDRLKGCSFNYTSDRIEFDVEYSLNIISNESFLVMENKKVIGAAAIYIEENKGQKEISWNGGYCLAPYLDCSLSYKEHERYAKKIMLYIETLAKQYNCSEIWLRFDPLINPAQKVIFYNYNYLLKYDYMDHSSLTQIIDLRKSQTELYSDIRKGHKSDIKLGREYEIEIYDASNVTEKQIQLYKEIYEKDAGRVTRNSELYMHYLYFTQNDHGALALAKRNENYVAVMIVTLFQNTAYYSSYGELTEELKGIPAGHAMQWHMIQYLKDRGIEYYELGEQVYGNTHYSCPEKKLLDISNYKRGFGGYTVPFWRGKKTIMR